MVATVNSGVDLFARVLRDSSAIYRDRFALLNERRFKQTGAVEFNWLLSVKLLCKHCRRKLLGRVTCLCKRSSFQHLDLIV